MALYVHHNSQQMGPFTVAEVKSQLASGALSAQDHVWWKGQQGWMPLASSPVLQPGFVDPSAAVPVKKGPELTGVSSFAVAALVAGILGFVLAFFAAFPAILFGHFALAELKQNPKLRGRKMALTGLGLGYFVILICAVMVVCFFYFRDEVQAAKDREEAMKTQIFVPPIPQKTITPIPKPAPTNAAPISPNAAPVVTNADQPIPPATALPGDTNRGTAEK